MTGLTAQLLIERLQLSRHPEGGWFRESYRSPELVAAGALPERFKAARSLTTAIYFLLERGDISALHRIKSDEIWHFYAGSPLTVHVIAESGEHRTLELGPDAGAGQNFQGWVPAGAWFGAELAGTGAFALVGCTVAPGFDFADFEMADRDRLLAHYPQHAEVIRRLTRAPA